MAMKNATDRDQGGIRQNYIISKLHIDYVPVMGGPMLEAAVCRATLGWDPTHVSCCQVLDACRRVGAASGSIALPPKAMLGRCPIQDIFSGTLQWAEDAGGGGEGVHFSFDNMHINDVGVRVASGDITPSVALPG